MNGLAQTADAVVIDTTSSSVVGDPAELDAFTCWVGEAGGSRIAESSPRIFGMHCAACAGTIEQALVRGLIRAET